MEIIQISKGKARFHMVSQIEKESVGLVQIMKKGVFRDLILLDLL